MPLIEKKTRIICFAPSDIAEMIDLFAFLNAVRRHFSTAHLAVACDAEFATLARACGAVDEVVTLERSRISVWAAWKNSRRLRKYDWAISGKAGIDPHLARLVKGTGARVRIGFERQADRRSSSFTDPVELPENPAEEHRIETLMRLLKPLGFIKSTNWSAEQLQMRLPESARKFAAEAVEVRPFIMGKGHVIINLSSSQRLKFSENDILVLSRHLLSSTPFTIALMAEPADQCVAGEIGLVLASNRIGVIEPMSPMEFAALVETSVFLITMENESTHLAAAMGVPAVVVWADGEFARTHSRCDKHVFVQADATEKSVPIERVWQAVQAVLSSKKFDIKKQWADQLQVLPPDFTL